MNKDAEELGIGFVSPDKGWVGTAAGGFETSDGGKSWKPSTLAPKANKIRVQAADGNAHDLRDRQRSADLSIAR